MYWFLLNPLHPIQPRHESAPGNQISYQFGNQISYQSIN